MTFDPSSFLISDGNAESGNNPLGYHDPSTSTAAGRFGITDTTWRGLMNTRPDLGLSWGNRLDDAANTRAATALSGEWANNLSNKGLPVDNSTLGLSSLVGPAAAAALLKADPTMAVSDVLSSAVGPQQAQQMIQANPTLLGGGKNVGSLVAANQSRMGMPQASVPSMSVQANPAPQQPPVQQSPQFQAQPTPPMPQGFGAAPPSNPAIPQVAQVDQSAMGSPLVGMGLAMMGGNGWHDAMAKAGAAYQNSEDQRLQIAKANAELQNSAAARQSDEPLQAAQAASLRAQAWRALNPTLTPAEAGQLNLTATGQQITQRGQDIDQSQANSITPAQSAQMNLTARGQDVQMADANARAAYMAQMAKGQPQQFVVPAEDGSQGKTVEVQTLPTGQQRFMDLSTGQQLPGLPAGAVPMQSFNQEANRDFKTSQTNAKDVSTMMSAGMAADNQLENLNRISADLNKPGALAGPGVGLQLARTIDGLAGGSLLGNKTDEDVSKMDLGQLNWNSVRDSIHGTGGRLTQQEVGLLGKNFANIQTDPVARQTVMAVTSHALQRQSDIAKQW